MNCCKEKEKVLVVPRNKIMKIIPGNSNNFISENIQDIYFEVLKDHYFWERELAEQDFELKQIIPYLVICFKGKILLTKRTKKQTESRLHDKYSIGLGGHINPEDLIDGIDIIQTSLNRELNEEIFLESFFPPKLIGVLNDDSDDVSRCHLGLVFLIELKESKFEILEKNKMFGELVEIEKLKNYRAKLETWSEIIARELFWK